MRVAFVGFLCVLVGCNALSGIGDYAVVDGDLPDSAMNSDADVTDAPADSTNADVGSGDATTCVLNDHPARTPTNCETGIGSDMATMPYGANDFHCIDRTEVTVAQYQQFLMDRGPNMCGQPAECAFNTTYTPVPGGPFSPSDDVPQTNIDWCDAFMYCQWAGKHLCGHFAYADPPTPPANIDPNIGDQFEDDEWDAFCVGQASNYAYFYAETPTPGTCVDGTSSGGHLASVKSARGCHGISYASDVWDLAGNAAEWEWSCISDACAIRGGSFIDVDPSRLACASRVLQRRSDVSPYVGFRCCVE